MSDNITIPDVDVSEMSVSDWLDFLTQHKQLAVHIHDHDGKHRIEYDRDDERVIFYAHGAMGYDSDGTRGALQAIVDAAPENEPDPDGLWIEERRGVQA